MRFDSPKDNLVANLLFLIIMIVITPIIPGVSWFRLGDFTLDTVNFYHVIMLPLAYSLILGTFYILNPNGRLTRYASVLNIPFLLIDLLGLVTFYRYSLLTLNALLQTVRDLLALIFAVLLGLYLLYYPIKKRDEFRKSYGAIILLLLAVWSSIIASILGMMYEFGSLYGFSSISFLNNYINSIGGTTVVLPNLLTSHSHEMLPAVMGGIVGLSALALNYYKLDGRIRSVANIGMLVSSFGIISMTVIYVISSLWTYSIPTLFSFGPGDVNGLAFDDSQTGIVGWGAIILGIAMFYLKGDKDYLRLRNLEIFTWIGAMISMIGIGYVIEFNESFYGFGSPGTPPSGGPGYMYDLAFTDGHLILTFFILVIIASIFAIVALIRKENIKLGKALYYFIFAGIILGIEGLLVYTMTTYWQIEAVGVIIILLGVGWLIIENFR